MAEKERKDADTPQSQEEQNIEDFDVNAIIEGSSPDSQAFSAPQKDGEDQQDPKGEEGEEIDNDTKRYQYWQSQADKMKNQNEKLRSELDELKGKVDGLSQLGQQPQNTNPNEQEQDDEFPSPPEPPQKPAGFSQAEAVNDPSSESAQYLQEREQWRDNMVTYQELKSRYLEEKQKEFFNKQRKEKEKLEQQQKKRAAVRSQVTQLERKVQEKYGATQEQARDFIRSMSSPDAVTIDNLWKLYNMNNGNQDGGQRAEQKKAGAPGGPSKEFLQMKKAQSVPSPMGVMPGTSGNRSDNRPVEDVVMEKIIKDEKERNPF